MKRGLLFIACTTITTTICANFFLFNGVINLKPKVVHNQCVVGYLSAIR